MSELQTGMVKWFNGEKGYGFISREGQSDVFVHYRAIIGPGRRILHQGQLVRFALVEGEKGPQADQVTPL